MAILALTCCEALARVVLFRCPNPKQEAKMAETTPTTHLNEEDQRLMAALLEIAEANLANGTELAELHRLRKRDIYARHGIDRLSGKRESK
jgi:hypothetical protein